MNENQKQLALLRENYELLKQNIKSLEESKTLRSDLQKEIDKMNGILKEIKDLEKGFPAKVEITNQPEQKEFPKEIEVKNFPDQKDFPKSFEISNLEKIKIPEFPKKIEAEDKGFIQTIKELGVIKTFLGKISEKINNFKQIDSVFIRNKTTDEAIPVKLADKDGKRFYNAIASAISAGVAPTDVSALATQITVADILTTLQGTLTVTGGGGGVEYTEDAAAATNPVGGATILVRADTPATQVSADGDNVAQRGTNYGAAYVQLVTSAGAFIDSVGGGTQYADGAVRGTATGTIAMGDDGTNIQSLKVDADGHPQIDVLTMPTVAVTGTFWQATQPVSGTFYQATQPVSAASLPLPAGASTSAKQDTQITAEQAIQTAVEIIDNAISGTEMQVDLLSIVGTVSTVNSSSTPLAIGGVFTGTSEDVKDYSSIIIATKSDVASATNGLSIQFSTDGTNWDHIDAHTIPAATSHTLTIAPQARYFRIVYTNGGTIQASFRLQAIFRSTAVGPQMETLSGDVSDTNFALTTRAVLAAKKPDGSYTNIQATAGGNLKVSIEEQDGAAGLATSAKQDTLLTELQLKADLTETQPVSLASVPSHAVTNAGTFAVQAAEADGANVTLGAKADAKSTATDTTAITIMQVLKQISASVQAPPSQAVTGTFYQATQPVSGTVDTELPAAAALSDAFANPTTPVIGSALMGWSGGAWDRLFAYAPADNAANDRGLLANSRLMVYDGATWDMLRGNATDGALVNLGANNDVMGDIAHDGVDSGNPVKIGFKAVALDGTPPPAGAVAEGDRANGISDLYGRQFVTDVHPNLWDVSVDYATAQTNASVKAAPGAGLSLYITDISISNGAVAGNITLLDGSGGTVKYEIYPAINGGAVDNKKTPIKLTANTALCITSTTVTTHSLNISGFIAP